MIISLNGSTKFSTIIPHFLFIQPLAFNILRLMEESIWRFSKKEKNTHCFCFVLDSAIKCLWQKVIHFHPIQRYQTSWIWCKHSSNSGNQCLGSRSVGSARFRLPGSRSAKCADPDPKGKISTENCKKKLLFSLILLWTIEKR